MDEMDDLWPKVEKAQELMKRLILGKQELIRKKYSHNSRLDEMTRSVEVTIQCLSDEDSGSRLVALLILDAFHFEFDTQNLLSQFEKMAFNDPDSEVREFAMGVLGSEARSHPLEIRKAIGRRMAEIIVDESAHIGYRKAAYRGLCFLSPHYFIRTKGHTQPRFPEEVDWGYVYSWKRD